MTAPKHPACCHGHNSNTAPGGKARAAKLSPERRREIATKASHAARAKRAARTRKERP